jgi:importin subunit beta-1
MLMMRGEEQMNGTLHLASAAGTNPPVSTADRFLAWIRCDDPSERKEAYEKLAEFVETDYELLGPVIEKVANASLDCIRNDEDVSVAMASVEFWSTLADEENERAPHSAEYVNSTFQKLLPVLLGAMARQPQEEPDEEDENEWNISTAGATCLSVIAEGLGDPIVGPVVLFVTGNMDDADWHKREAATMAFGCIMAGPSWGALKGQVQQKLPMLLTAIGKDPSSAGE